jgi:arylsulfatase A-like enzyme
MIERLDTAVGRVLAALDKEGLAKNTLVVFTSDNGGTASARPSGLRGQKGSTFEGGIRVPCIVRWPGRLRAGVTSAQVTLTFDLTASLARAADARLPAGRAFDGIDVLARLERGESELPRTVFWRGRRGDNTWKAVRAGLLKYVLQTDAGAIRTEALFDVVADPAERYNLLATRGADAQRLRGLLAAWEKEVAPVR